MGKYTIHEGEVKGIELPGRKNTLIIGPHAFGGCKSMCMGIAEFPPGILAPEHIHQEEEEIGYILSGEGELYVGGSVEELKPGICTYLPPKIPHQTRNTGKSILKVIYVFSPPLSVPPVKKE